MKSNAKTLLKVLVATAILCLFTAIGASAEVKNGTFTDAKKSTTAASGYEPNNTYTYEFDTESGHLIIDVAKKADGTYAHDGEMTYEIDKDDDACNSYVPWRNTAYKFEDGTAFTRDMIKSVEIGAGVKKLGRRLLSKTAITNLTVPGTVNAGTEWGVATECDDLKNIKFGEGVASIGMEFAYNCKSLSNIELPRTVTYIHPQAFGNSATNASVKYYPSNETILKQIANMKANKDNTNLEYEAINKIYSGEFTDDKNDIFIYSLTADFDDTKYDWTNTPAVKRTLIVDSKSVITDEAKYMDIADASFNKLPQYLNKDNGVTSDNKYPWDRDNWKTQVSEVTFGKNIINVGRSLCEGMSNLKKVVVPGNVVMAHWGAFQNCTSLEEAIFEEGFRNFEQGKNFQNCTSLKNVYIPLSIEKMNAAMFNGTLASNNPTSVNLHYWNSANSDAQIINAYSGRSYIKPVARTGNLEILAADSEGVDNAIKIDFNSDTMVMNISANKDESGNRIGNGRIRTSTNSWSKKDAQTGMITHGERAPYSWLQGTVKEINIGDGIEYVPSSFVILAHSMNKIAFGSSVKEISAFAVNGSTSLINVEFAEGIETLRSGIFNNCTKLTNVTIPKSAKSVGTLMRHTSTWASAPDNAVVTAYKGSAGEIMLFGLNADKVAKFTAANQEYRRNEAKIINDDGSVAYVLLNPNSTSALATEAAGNGYKTVTFGVPVVKIADDKTSADAAFTGAAAKGILIATKHDANGNMTAVQLDGVTAKSAGYYTVDFDDTFKAAEGTVTAMLWDGIDTMKPLCASVSK